MSATTGPAMNDDRNDDAGTVARIRVTDGPRRGHITFAAVTLMSGRPVAYRPIADPFTGAPSPLTADPVPADQAVLLAPTTPRLVVGMAHNTGPADRLLPPEAFLKSPHSVVGPGDGVQLPADATEVDGEAELAAVIGRVAKDLTPEQVPAAVFGFTAVNDVTDRAAQRRDGRWTEAKSRDTFTPLGPWIARDLDSAAVTIRLGDEAGLGPAAVIADLARDVVEVLVYVTSVLTLHPGDVVLLGAPGPSRRLRPGGETRVFINGLGELVNPVVTSPAPAHAVLTLTGGAR